MRELLWICLGGALGTGARHLVGVGVAAALGPGFPIGTLLVNVLGSFLIALVMVLGDGGGPIPAPVRVVLATGVMGGFTTYSSFNHETLRLIQDGAWGLATANVLVTLVTCAAAGLLGMAIGARLTGTLG